MSALPKQDAELNTLATEERAQAEELRQVQKALVFPAIPEEPLIALPPWPIKGDDSTTEKKSRSRRSKKAKDVTAPRKPRKRRGPVFEGDASIEEAIAIDLTPELEHSDNRLMIGNGTKQN